MSVTLSDASFAISSSVPHSVTAALASISKPINLRDKIRLVEEQITLYGTGPFTAKQQDDLDKYKLVLQRARSELEKTNIIMNNQTKPALISESGHVIPSVGAISGLIGSPMPQTMTVRTSDVSQSSSAGSTTQNVDTTKILDKKRIQDLVKEVDPLEQLDDDVEELLLQVADDFLETVVTYACQLARHRKSNVLEAKDVQLHLERNWNMVIPGFGYEELHPYKRSMTTEAHKQRMALIKKTLKKY